MRQVLKIRPGDTLFDILKTQGIPAGESLTIIRRSKPVFNTARIKPGNPLLLVFNPEDRRLSQLAYEISDTQRLVVTVKGDRITARKIVVSKGDRLVPTSPAMPARTISSPPAPTPAAYAPAPSLPQQVMAAPDDLHLRQVTVKVRKGQNLFTILSKQGVKPQEIDACAKVLKGVFNVSGLKPGKTIDIWFTTDEHRRIARMSYPIDRTRRLEVVSTEGAFRARTVAATDRPECALPVNARQAQTFRQLLETDYDYIAATGDVFAYLHPEAILDIPAALPLHASYGAGSSRGTERIIDSSPTRQHSCETQRTRNIHKVAHAQKMFLKAPLRYRTISSGYSKCRTHPVYHVARPHLGIDYAAPIGTKVHAIADGKVIFKGWSSGFGQMVKIRHANGYVSYYGHLGKYPPKLRVGKTVAKGDVIGYVGMTGVTTGPHLDFRISRNGRYVNPLKVVTGKRPV